MSAITGTVLLLAAAASDESFEARGRNVLALEGVAGAASYRVSYPNSGLEPTTTSRFGVLGTVPFSRAGYHRFVLRGLSVGAGVQLTVSELSEHYGRDAIVASFAPRLGYALTLVGRTALWLRGGASILYGARPNSTFGQISLAAEALLVAGLTRDFAATVMVFGETGIAGREVYEQDGTSHPIRLQTTGLSVGVLIAF
jgi:hypothetical protein